MIADGKGVYRSESSERATLDDSRVRRDSSAAGRGTRSLVDKPALSSHGRSVTQNGNTGLYVHITA